MERAGRAQAFSVVGLRTVHELRGIPSITLDSMTAAKQQICVSRSFGYPVRTCTDMCEAVAYYTAIAASKLRRNRQAAGAVFIYLATNWFKDEPQHHETITMTMPVPTDSTQELTTAAIAGARRMFREGYRYKKAGVILIDLTPVDQVQTDLFDSRDRATDNRISAALDRINGRLGTGTLHYAAEGIEKPWHTKFAMRSPRYTTRWDELPVVKAI